MVKRVVKEKEREWRRVNSGELPGTEGDWPIQVAIYVHAPSQEVMI